MKWPITTLKRLWRNGWFYGPAYLFIAFLGAVLIKVLILEICVVPSKSMENTLLPGDWVIVNKLAYGPRLPRSLAETPWMNGIYFMLSGGEAYQRAIDEGQKKNYQRWKGFGSAKRGDVVVFNSPIRKGRLMIKRLVALPGDTIQMLHGQWYVNGVLQPIPSLGEAQVILFGTGKRSTSIGRLLKIIR
jgi:signal peptidase I